MTTPNLPTIPTTVPTTKIPMSGVPAVNEIMKSVPTIVDSFAGIIDSCNNRALRLGEIQANASAQITKIEKVCEVNLREIDFKDNCMQTAFNSGMDGEQIINLLKELQNGCYHSF